MPVALKIDPALKTCSICGSQKPIEDFHKRRHYSRDGRRAACKACTSMKKRSTREARGNAAISDEERRKQQVRYRTRKLILAGELVPRPCETCRALDVQAHHPEYDSPEAHRHVRWLCPMHHAQEHGVRGWTRQMDLFPESDSSTPRSGVETSRSTVTYQARLEDA